MPLKAAFRAKTRKRETLRTLIKCHILSFWPYQVGKLKGLLSVIILFFSKLFW